MVTLTLKRESTRLSETEARSDSLRSECRKGTGDKGVYMILSRSWTIKGKKDRVSWRNLWAWEWVFCFLFLLMGEAWMCLKT